MPWLLSADVVTLWPEAEGIDETLLDILVDAALVQCESYAPDLAEGAAVPANWRLAQLMQVQALWNSSKSGPGDQIGPEGFTVTTYPMDRTVKNLLRPKRGIPVVG